MGNTTGREIVSGDSTGWQIAGVRVAATVQYYVTDRVQLDVGPAWHLRRAFPRSPDQTKDEWSFDIFLGARPMNIWRP